MAQPTRPQPRSPLQGPGVPVGREVSAGQGTIRSSSRSSCSSLLMWSSGAGAEKKKKIKIFPSLPGLGSRALQGLITKREMHEASRGNPTLPGNPLHRPVLPPAPRPVAKSRGISPAGHAARALRIIFLLPPQAFQGPFSFLVCPQSLQTRGFPPSRCRWLPFPAELLCHFNDPALLSAAAASRRFLGFW